MSSGYEGVAGTRPRIRRDVLFTQTPDGVLFHNASSGFRIRSTVGYRLATILVPHLNGTNRLADLCDRLPAAHRDMIGELVSALYARGFARDVPAPDPQAVPVLAPAVVDRFAAQIAYVDHYVDDAPRRFAAFRSTVVAIVGTGGLAESCAAGLIRNGMAEVRVPAGAPARSARAEAAAVAADDCPVTVLELGDPDPGWTDLAGVDVVLVAGGDAAARRVHRLLAAGVPAGVSVLPAWQYGERVIIGPLLGEGRPGCWCCAMLRLGTNGDAHTAARIWSGIALPGPPPPAGPPVSGPLAAMIGNLLAYEVFRFTTGVLPAETAGKVLVQHIGSLDVLAEALLPHPRCPFCAAPEPAGPGPLPLSWAAVGADDLARDGDAVVEELNARSMLLQPHVGVLTAFRDDEFLQTPLKVGAVEFTDAAGRRRLVPAFDLHHVAAARRRALYDAVVAYTGQLAVTTPAGQVPAAGRVRATSLLTGVVGSVPAAAAEPFGAANADRVVEPTRCGGGAGADLDEAVRHGLASALAYRALTRAIAGTAEVRAVAMDDVDGSAELTFLRKSAANLGVVIELLELSDPADLPLPVLVARCPDPLGGPPLWTLAADPAWHGAAVRALTDLIGQVQLRTQPTPDHAGDGADPVLLDFAPATLRATRTVPARPDLAHDWAQVSAALASAGLDGYVVPVGGADLAAAGVVAVRVVLTGSEVEP